MEWSLVERQRVLDASVKAVSRKIASHQRKHARVRQANARAQMLCVRAAHVVWIMFSLSADPRGAVLHFLRGGDLKRRYARATDESLLELAERSFLEADLGEIASYANERAPASALAMRLAKRLLAEWDLFKWCSSLNERVGAAPSTVAFLRRAGKHLEVLPTAAFEITRSGRPALKARKWAARWRKRWGARMGTSRAREHYSVDEIKAKVSVSYLLCVGPCH